MTKKKTEDELLAELNKSWNELKEEVENIADNGMKVLLKKGQPLLNKTISVLNNINKKMQKEVENDKGKTNRKK